jgi:YggT family protein
MVALIQFLYIVTHLLIEAAIWLIVAAVVAQWLVQFDVINMRNRMASQVVHMLDMATRPILRPVSRIIPPLGGLDFSPMIVMIVLIATDQALLPALFGWLESLVSPG